MLRLAHPAGGGPPRPGPRAAGAGHASRATLASVARYLPTLLRAAGVTLALSLLSMALAVAGCMVPGTRILDPACVGKSWPGFWDSWDALLMGGW